MKHALAALEDIYIDELPTPREIESQYSIEIVEYLLDTRLVDFITGPEQEVRVHVTNKGLGILREYGIIDQ